MALYLHDGSYQGQTSWSVEALRAGVADALVVSPFFTPWLPRKAQPNPAVVAEKVRDAGGEFIIDATTHGLRLPGVDNLASYNTWQLWAGARGDLSTDDLIEQHVERVFERQDDVSAPRLTPTVALDSPIGGDADTALAMAQTGRRADERAWQSLAGRRGLWLSEGLDDYVGSLAQLRAPVWFVTHVREEGVYPPDMTEAAQVAALCRTVESLSLRSRVVLCQADLFGLPAVAAGADTVGTGWHTKQRVCSPAAYQTNDPDSVRRAATWFTYQGLSARIHKTYSDILTDRDRARAARLYPGAVVATGRNVRNHHLQVVRDLTATVGAHPSRADRVAALRSIYETAVAELDELARPYGRTFTQQRSDFIDGPMAALKMYAEAEGIWD